MPTFTLLHASDFHMARTPYGVPPPPPPGRWEWLKQLTRRQADRLYQVGIKAHDPEVLAAFAGWVYRNRARLRAVVLTGDLSNTGRRVDLNRAHRFLTAQAVTTCFDKNDDPTLGFLPRDRLIVLPGNHDRYRDLLRHPGGRLFDKVFGAFWPAGFQGVWGWRVPDAARDLVIVGADFALSRGDPGKKHFWLPGRFGQGRAIGPKNLRTLRRLRVATRNLRQRYRNQNGAEPLVIWAIHFDVFSPDESLQLLGSRSLVRAARQERVPVILAGHTHESKVKPIAWTGPWPPPPPRPDGVVLVCGTTAQAGSDQGNDFQVLTLNVPDEGDPVAGLSVRVEWHRYANSKRFVQLSPACEVEL